MMIESDSPSDRLRDPSARVFEVFLIVLDGVRGETLWGGDPNSQSDILTARFLGLRLCCANARQPQPQLSTYLLTWDRQLAVTVTAV